MADVRFGSEADIGTCPDHVRFTPESGRSLERTNVGASSFAIGARRIGPMERARYQGYERRGASSAFQRVIWNIKRQNIFVCFSDVTHVTIHGTTLTCDLRLAVHEGARVKDTDANRLNFALLGQKIVLISHKRLVDNGSPATQNDPLSMSALGPKRTSSALGQEKFIQCDQ